MTTSTKTRTTSTDSSVTLKDVRPQADRRSKVKRFLSALMRALAAVHA